MRFYVAITDHDWFTQLARGEPPDEVNFWQPGGNRVFQTLAPGEPFLFKLHSPNDFIVGGGFFGHSTILPASLAWRAFQEKNGAKTETEMRARIERYRRVSKSRDDYNVGCILLQSPFFLARDEWIPLREWSKPIVQGKGFDSESEPGQSLWIEVQSALSASTAALPVDATGRDESSPRFGSPRTGFARLGQGSFRVVVTDAYDRRCAFTDSPILYVLEAGHIKPYSEGGPHEVQNGILMRQDFHTLFDKGYVTVTPEYRVEVSRRIHEEFDNGHEYYALHGKAMTLPENPGSRPAGDFLTWHNETKFRG
jgi:putative restriction endonuclease